MRVLRVVVVSMACATLGTLACSMPAFAQAPPQDNLQPGVNTSAMPAQPPAAATSSPVAAAATADASGKNGARSAAQSSSKSSSKSSDKRAAGAPAAAGKTATGGKAIDRLDLDTTQITGNKELPTVMYVVPWKRADLGDLTGKPANSLVDEVLQPVDRDVFNREERYYHTVAPQKGPSEPPPGVPAGH